MRMSMIGVSAEKILSIFLPDSPFVCKKTPFIITFVGIFYPLVGFRKTEQAFTLIELVITLTVASILLVVAIPGFNQFVQSNRLAAGTNDFIASISFTRSEALKRASGVGLCPSNSGGTGCDLSTSWASGWVVFTDTDNNNSWTASTDQVVRAYQTLPPGTAVTASSTLILFNSQGRIPTAANNDYNFCNTSLGKGRRITLSPSGQHRIQDLASC